MARTESIHTIMNGTSVLIIKIRLGKKNPTDEQWQHIIMIPRDWDDNRVKVCLYL